MTIIALTEREWARVRAYAQTYTRAKLTADPLIAWKLGMVAKGYFPEPVQQHSRFRLHVALVREALKWATHHPEADEFVP